MTGLLRSTKKRYRTLDMPVRGGELRLGVWEPVDGAGRQRAPTVVAVHGVTASHRCWSTVAERLPGMRVIAPDLRGRGRSRDLPGPYGMAQHAADVAAALDHLELDSAGFVGHSMGAFMVVAMSALHPDRVGPSSWSTAGCRCAVPEGLTPDQVTTAILGPAKQRLSMTFPDRETYRNFFRAHPAFAGEWSDAVADYVDYDLVGEPPELRAATSIRRDGPGLGGPAARRGLAAGRLANLPPGTPFLRAQGGMLGAEPGLYPTGLGGGLAAAVAERRRPGRARRESLHDLVQRHRRCRRAGGRAGADRGFDDATLDPVNYRAEGITDIG